MTLRIAIVDDHTLVRQSVCALLGTQKDLQVVGEAGDLESACALVRETAPDLIVLEAILASSCGVTIARELLRLRPQVRIVFLSMHTTEDLVVEAFSTGAHGYVGKEQPANVLFAGIRAVARGELFLSPGLPRSLMAARLDAEQERRPSKSPVLRLSAREREVLDLLLQGCSSESIAARLLISRRSVESHRTHVLRKLKAPSVAGFFRLAARYGLMAPGAALAAVP